MLGKTRLSTHLLVLFLFLEGVALIMGGLSVGTIQRLNGRITNLQIEDIPLMLAISEITKDQLDQTLHMNEILLYGEADDREKFELSNNEFVGAGKRLTNVLVEALHITQKGMDNSTSALEKQQLNSTKTVLSEYQKIHKSFENLSGIIIRNKYKYRFLTRAGIITGNEDKTLAEAESDYIKQLSKSISDLDDETKRMQNKLKEAFHVTRNMVKDLAPSSSKERNIALTIFFLAMTIFTFGGGFLALSIAKMHQNRVNKNQNNRRKLAAPFKEKAMLLKQSTEQLNTILEKLASNNNTHENSSKSAAMVLPTMITLVANNARISTEIMLLSHEIQQKTNNSDEAMQAFKEISARSMALANRIQKGLHSLVQMIMQVKLLATSASAEASRKNASQGFMVFTNEIKELAQNSVKTVDMIAELVERDVKEIESRHNKVVSSRQMLAEVVEATSRLTNNAKQVEATSHKQSESTHQLQDDIALIHHGVANNRQLLQDGGELCQTLRSHTTTFLTTLEKLVASFDDRRADERRKEEDEKALLEIAGNKKIVIGSGKEEEGESG